MMSVYVTSYDIFVVRQPAEHTVYRVPTSSHYYERDIDEY